MTYFKIVIRAENIEMTYFKIAIRAENIEFCISATFEFRLSNHQAFVRCSLLPYSLKLYSHFTMAGR